MQNPRVFVSFSSKDAPSIRRLFARLGAQSLEVWDYSTEGQEIPGGAQIDEYLNEKIAKCDLFIPVLSENSFASKFTAKEVKFALSYRRLEGHIKIIPLLVHNCNQNTSCWPLPYNQLANTLFYSLNFFSRQELEEVITMICDSMGITYRPLLTCDPKLPFMAKLESELMAKCPQRTERDIGVYRRLMLILDKFQRAFESGDFFRALENATFIVMTIESEFAENSFYYAYIVKAVCEISCGQLLKASETLSKTWDSPLLDENAFGAMGHIRYQQGDYHGALEFFRTALKYDKEDPAAKSWVAKTSLLVGARVDVEKLFGTTTLENIGATKEEIDFAILKAMSLASLHRLDEAEKIYIALINNGVCDQTILTNYAYVMLENGRKLEALDMMEKYGGDLNADNHSFSHLLASLYFLIGEPKKSADRFKKLVDQCPHNRQYRIEAAQVLWQIGDQQGSRAIIAPMLNCDDFPLPANEYDFYYDGFAHWINEEVTLAEYDFRRSRMSVENHYERILNGSKLFFNVTM